MIESTKVNTTELPWPSPPVETRPASFAETLVAERIDHAQEILRACQKVVSSAGRQVQPPGPSKIRRNGSRADQPRRVHN